jgi:hypothetical protein
MLSIVAKNYGMSFAIDFCAYCNNDILQPKHVTILRWIHEKITNVQGTKLPKTFKVQQSFSATIFNLSKHKHMGLKMKGVLTTSLGEGKVFRQPTKLTGWDWAIYFDGWSQECYKTLKPQRHCWQQRLKTTKLPSN